MNSIKSILSNLIKDTDTVLDIGCGRKDYSIFGKHTVTIDAWKNVNPDIVLDLQIEDIPFHDNTFDCILLIDFIEHIEKNRGFHIINQCKNIAIKRIILFTPLIWDDNSRNVNDPNCWAYQNQFDYHKSLWTLDDFIKWNIYEEFKPNSFFGYWNKQ